MGHRRQSGHLCRDGTAGLAANFTRLKAFERWDRLFEALE
jgi:hypothetical protein